MDRKGKGFFFGICRYVPICGVNDAALGYPSFWNNGIGAKCFANVFHRYFGNSCSIGFAYSHKTQANSSVADILHGVVGVRDVRSILSGHPVRASFSFFLSFLYVPAELFVLCLYTKYGSGCLVTNENCCCEFYIRCLLYGVFSGGINPFRTIFYVVFLLSSLFRLLFSAPVSHQRAENAAAFFIAQRCVYGVTRVKGRVGDIFCICGNQCFLFFKVERSNSDFMDDTLFFRNSLSDVF